MHLLCPDKLKAHKHSQLQKHVQKLPKWQQLVVCRDRKEPKTALSCMFSENLWLAETIKCVGEEGVWVGEHILGVAASSKLISLAAAVSRDTSLCSITLPAQAMASCMMSVRSRRSSSSSFMAWMPAGTHRCSVGRSNIGKGQQNN